MGPLKNIILAIGLTFLVQAVVFGQSLKIATWNIANFGPSKTDVQLEEIAKVLRPFDLVAIQEVGTSQGAKDRLAKLDAILDRKGGDWGYVVSNPTTGRGSECYAYFWRKDRMTLKGVPWLESSLADSLDREPFMARFGLGNKTLLLANFHAVPAGKSPARENGLLFTLDALYPRDAMILMGDFNASWRSPAFSKLRRHGFSPVFFHQKTTLKMEPDDRTGERLAHDFDNLFFEGDEWELRGRGVVDFSGGYPTLKEARALSDHLPVWGHFSLEKTKRRARPRFVPKR